MSLLPAIPRIPPAVAGVAHRPRGRRAAAQPGLRGLGVPAGRAPPGAADPRLHGRRPLARHDGELAAARRLLHAPHGHPRQLRLLGGGVPAPRGAARAHGRAPRRARRRHRPEPRRRLREARSPPGGRSSSQGIVTLGSPTARQLAVHPLVLAQVGLVSALGTAHVPGMFSRQLPARQVLRGVPGGASRARSRTTSATSRVYSQAATGSCSGAPASTRRPTSSSRSAPRTAAWASTPRPSSPSRTRSARFRARRDPLLADGRRRSAA